MGTPFNKIGGNPIVLGLDGLKDEVKAGLNTPADTPALAVGSAAALLGDAETASWMERTTAADGAALVDAIYGNTVVQDGSLLPVRMEGIETVGFNQWDEQWELGTLDSSGQPTASTSVIRSKNFIPVLPSTAYYIAGLTSGELRPFYYDGDKAFVSRDYWAGGTANNPFTIPSNARYMKFAMASSYGTTYNNDICINLSDPSRNGTYEPYWSSQLAIPAATYFPGGLRSAGSVRDELRADAAVTRVGAMDLGTLDWTPSTDRTDGKFKSSRVLDIMHTGLTNLSVPRAECAKYTPRVYFSDRVNDAYDIDKSIGFPYSDATSAGTQVFVYDSAYTNASALKTALSGVLLYYELAAPTTQSIDPPLPMSYRTGAGGTERVMVASGTQSAPPVFVTRYPLDPADLAASIAPVDGPTAKTNHQVGDLLMLGFTLCKATQVIVTGETIEIGTNVTRTTVAAELAALSE